MHKLYEFASPASQALASRFMRFGGRLRLRLRCTWSMLFAVARTARASWFGSFESPGLLGHVLLRSCLGHRSQAFGPPAAVFAKASSARAPTRAPTAQIITSYTVRSEGVWDSTGTKATALQTEAQAQGIWGGYSLHGLLEEGLEPGRGFSFGKGTCIAWLEYLALCGSLSCSCLVL